MGRVDGVTGLIPSQLQGPAPCFQMLLSFHLFPALTVLLVSPLLLVS